ncbi:MAG: selenoneine synthase SenA [Burkholderiales bacterium]
MATLDIKDVRAHLVAARKRVLTLTRDLDNSQLLGPRLDIVNPPIWELGHIAWFQERWCVRRRENEELGDAMIANADKLYDSERVAHDARWGLPLLDLLATRKYLNDVLIQVIDRLDARPDDRQALYFAELSAAHEDIHAEAIHHAWQVHGYEGPQFDLVRTSARLSGQSADGDVSLPGGAFMQGAYPEHGFVFDNEKWAHEVLVAPFAISRAPVSNEQYLAFVLSDGYRRREWWSEEGWMWVQRNGLVAPRYWRQLGGKWMERRFDRIVPLPPSHPVMHVSCFEAEAYCKFARRRLPTEPEWEFAASHPNTGNSKRRFPWGDSSPTPQHANLETNETISVHVAEAGDTAGGCRQMIGNVWEWTSTTFHPYPGFVADPYDAYSRPSFGTHKVMRGGSFATPARLIRLTWRSFHLPNRNDPFVGFRTCAIS